MTSQTTATSPQLSQITIFPIKSTAGIHLNHSFVEEKGLIFDRRFVLVDNKGKFITARTHPRLALVHSAISEDGFHVRAPGMPALEINKNEFGHLYAEVEIWGTTVQGQWCHKNYDTWFSDYLDQPCRLLFFGEQSERFVSGHQTQVSFADGYPLLLISEASLADLNERADETVLMDQFRPNLVVKGCSAFAEDSWKVIQIGEVKFALVKPCSRCVFTTLDPLTGEKSPVNEPLNTLQKYRKGEDGQVYFGQNLVALNSGKISVFDTVEVLEYHQPIEYVNHAPKVREISNVDDRLDWPKQQAKSLLCVAVTEESHDVKTFRFSCPTLPRFSYLAGQYINIEVVINNKPYKRTYTLSSTPTRPDLLSITVKKLSDGMVSSWLHDHLTVGDSISAIAPAGSFHLQKALPEAPLLLISAGVGITPILAMLRAITDQHQARDIVFIHGAKTVKDLIAYQELNFFSSLLPKLSIHYFLSRETQHDSHQEIAGSKAELHYGHINQAALATVSDLSERTTFVCGPNMFMEQIKQSLLQLGLPEAQYFDESFGQKASFGGSKKQVNILFDSWDTYVEGDNQLTLLEQAEQAGLSLPFSCRGGMCGACKVQLHSGEVRRLSDSALTPDEIEAGVVLACSCVPQSDLVIGQT
ncbi:hybrid-cluster NAD(P)-dependent oxidoreductase [Motilimonas cestriensis]|uniref:Hybrid-cluster NAD(P)-dependent oxidoreductase n=1 Tax=Motilimonas cestriensis TaxID=2742685 RepID=A0ABS8WBJ1_9GAMM|nr:hybrid-cluster NAD(P)-dependent oxidoreductase [Motilimonas cestriensis]MCE2595116.1 hybrid-cluster NAD(P)-dependent oxidoreductase [Motilimonas cestriensis]